MFYTLYKFELLFIRYLIFLGTRCLNGKGNVKNQRNRGAFIKRKRRGKKKNERLTKVQLARVNVT